MNLAAVTIGESLECDGGQFISKNDNLALIANGAKVEGSVFLRNDFNAEGRVSFRSVTIRGGFPAAASGLLPDQCCFEIFRSLSSAPIQEPPRGR